MSNSEIPFYAQTAILDNYIHSSEPGADPDALEVILEMLRSCQDLRDYFFRSGPHAAWAPILWEHGFFNDPPSPKKVEGNIVLHRWDAQDYLISVASQVPEIVIRHIETIKGDGFYISQAIKALCLIEPEQAEQAVPRVIQWLQEPQIACGIAGNVFELVKRLAQIQKTSTVLSLFQALTEPLSSPNILNVGQIHSGAEAISKLYLRHYKNNVLLEGIKLFSKESLPQIVAILGDHLIKAIQLEGETKGLKNYDKSTWWRTAIEDTDQDLTSSYKHYLLAALRSAIEIWVQQEPQAVEPLLKRYLNDEREILRRMGFYILSRYPEEYVTEVAYELSRPDNLNDIGIHHEFFLLLEQGYSHIKSSDQERLIATICNGPPAERTKELAEWAQEQYGIEADEYISRYSKTWIRDRLWMLKDHLQGPPLQKLNELASELGEPSHPSFSHWRSGAYWVQEVSPIDEYELERKSPSELTEYLKKWEPKPDDQFGPRCVSYKGLADSVAHVVLAFPQKYIEQLHLIVQIHPEFACALMRQLIDEERGDTAHWDLWISVCEKLLANDLIRESMDYGINGSWVQARKYIVDLLGIGLDKAGNKPIAPEYLPRIKSILFRLVLDPDPDPARDQPEKGWFAHNDPATVAINHVRPTALLALIKYALYKAHPVANKEQDSLNDQLSSKLEEDVREMLTRKLDKKQDPSWAVHSIYGHYFPQLYWLDREWVKLNIDKIFPEKRDDEQSIWLFVAAWDSFVIFNPFHHPMLEMLRSKYKIAIENLGQGYITETHLQPDEKLSNHLIWDYLLSDNEINTSPENRSLLARFFEMASPESRGSTCWILWEILKNEPSKIETYWPKVRSLWEWRIHKSSIANHPIDFDNEMLWFAHLPLMAPSWENITSLWTLLEGMLPHITRSEQEEMGWETIEEYLSQEIDHNPVKVIHFYYLMHTQISRRHYWLYPKERARKIIEKAAACKESRQKALSLIDLLARLGIDQYRDIYDQYVG